jgi:hypothetical protein
VFISDRIVALAAIGTVVVSIALIVWLVAIYLG